MNQNVKDRFFTRMGNHPTNSNTQKQAKTMPIRSQTLITALKKRIITLNGQKYVDRFGLNPSRSNERSAGVIEMFL
jgi:lipopolysaccharide export system protein LptA